MLHLQCQNCIVRIETLLHLVARASDWSDTASLHFILRTKPSSTVRVSGRHKKGRRHGSEGKAMPYTQEPVFASSTRTLRIGSPRRTGARVTHTCFTFGCSFGRQIWHHRTTKKNTRTCVRSHPLSHPSLPLLIAPQTPFFTSPLTRTCAFIYFSLFLYHTRTRLCAPPHTRPPQVPRFVSARRLTVPAPCRLAGTI